MRPAFLDDLDLDDWRAVPGRVQALLKVAGPLALELKTIERIGDPQDQAWWDPSTGAVHVQSVKSAAWKMALIPGVTIAPDPPGGDLWVLIKRGAFLAGPTRVQEGAQRFLGGPNPMASAITGGLIGAGLGYGSGWALDSVLPDDVVEENAWRKRLTALGAALGAAPGIWSGTAQARMPEAGGSTAPGIGKYFRPAPWLSDYSWRDSGLKEVRGAWNPLFAKSAADFAEGTGILHVPSIPVDAFNQAIWNDVDSAPNPFGTKSPWGDNSQPMRTPPNIASFASGIVSGAGAATRQERVSPLQVAATAGMAAGVGYLGGMGLGKVFGVLAGLKPDAQRTLQRTGAWAGLITGAVRSLFN